MIVGSMMSHSGWSAESAGTGLAGSPFDLSYGIDRLG
jgi:hypothetical protein